MATGMTRPTPDRYTDAQRMELRSYAQLAGEVIAQYWPMRTFIHHNPLHGLESLPFEQAVQEAERLFGGRGYLPAGEYRRLLHSGRITEMDVRSALEPLASDKHVVFAGRPLTHLDVLVLAMRHGVTEDFPSEPPAHSAMDRDRLESWLESAGICDAPTSSAFPDSPDRETLSTWCDRTVGTTIVEAVNRELVKWCSVFLDEGEASWAMPKRDETFYRAWKSLAPHDATFRLLGIPDAVADICSLPERPEDALLDHLGAMRIPKAAWESYLALHLAALPGWTGYIKWRAHQTAHPWQEAFPIDPVKYLAVRLFYERVLVAAACRLHLGIEGQDDAVRTHMRDFPFAYRLRRAALAGLTSAAFHDEIARLQRAKTRHDHRAWEEAGRRYDADRKGEEARRHRERAALMLTRLARALAIDPAAIHTTAPSDLRQALAWLEGFSAAHQGAAWLRAFEASHRRRILDELARGLAAAEAHADGHQTSSRPLAQVVFCIDVRSEVFRRHLEHRGGYETLGLAGFFGVPLDYRPFNAHYAVSHCPVLLKPKNQVREIPRSYHGALAERHKTAAHLLHAARELLHDVKENVVTPYVMVEALGWFFGLPLLGKTLLPLWYERLRQALRRLFMPAVATTLTVDKIGREEAEAMVAAEHRPSSGRSSGSGSASPAPSCPPRCSTRSARRRSATATASTARSPRRWASRRKRKRRYTTSCAHAIESAPEGFQPGWIVSRIAGFPPPNRPTSWKPRCG